MQREEEDIRALGVALSSWQPELSSRDLRLEIWARAHERTRTEFLALVDQIGEVVEQACSGMSPCLISDSVFANMLKR